MASMRRFEPAYSLLGLSVLLAASLSTFRARLSLRRFRRSSRHCANAGAVLLVGVQRTRRPVILGTAITRGLGTSNCLVPGREALPRLRPDLNLEGDRYG